MDDAKAIQQQWVEAWRCAQVPEDTLVEGSLGGLELLLCVYNFFFPGTVSGGALYDDTKLAQTRMVLQLIGAGPLLMIHPHFPLKDSKVTPGRGVGNVAARIRNSLQRVMDGHFHEKPFGAKKVQFTKKAGRKCIDAAASVELKKDNDGYFVVDGKDFVIAPAEKTGRVMRMEDRSRTLVTTLQVLLSLSVPPVSIAVSCLSCLRRPPPLFQYPFVSL